MVIERQEYFLGIKNFYFIRIINTELIDKNIELI